MIVLLINKLKKSYSFKSITQTHVNEIDSWFAIRNLVCKGLRGELRCLTSALRKGRLISKSFFFYSLKIVLLVSRYSNCSLRSRYRIKKWEITFSCCGSQMLRLVSGCFDFLVFVSDRWLTSCLDWRFATVGKSLGVKRPLLFYLMFIIGDIKKMD